MEQLFYGQDLHIKITRRYQSGRKKHVVLDVHVPPAHLAAMDRLESLGNTLSNLTVYDLKSMYNQVRKICTNRPPNQ